MLSTVVALNNKGVNFCENGNCNAAAKYFQLAFEEILSLRRKYNEQYCKNQSLKQSELLRGCHKMGKTSVVLKGWSRPSCLYLQNKVVSQNDYTFLFSRAIVLEDCSSKENSEDINVPCFVLEKFIGAILYNKALSLHLHIYCNTTTAQTMPNKSLLILELYKMYELSYDCCKKSTAECSEGSIINNNVMFLALANNMGVILHNEMARFEDSAQCFAAVSCRIFKLDTNSLAGTLRSYEISQMLMNLMMVPTESTPAA